MFNWKFWEKWKRDKNNTPSLSPDSQQDLNQRVAMNTMLSSGAKAQTGDRYECCTGNLNNNQRLATLAMLRDFDD